MTGAFIGITITIAIAGIVVAAWSFDRAAVWRSELAKEREKRQRAEQTATERMGLLLEQHEKIARLERDFTNATIVLGYVEREKGARPN